MAQQTSGPGSDAAVASGTAPGGGTATMLSQQKQQQQPAHRILMPERWDSKDPRVPEQYLMFQRGSLRVRYTGPGMDDEEAAAVRANRPIPTLCGVYYYEVTIVSKGKDGYIGIGVCGANNHLDRLPGWDSNSYGYHGDDGYKFSQSDKGRAYGPQFTTGDVIGCGVNFLTRSIFYTKNGRTLGTAFTNIPDIVLYPVVGMRTVGETLDVNFGRQPFLFDFSAYLVAEKHALDDRIRSLPPALPFDHINQLVLQYLLHQGYFSAAERFAEATAQVVSSDRTGVARAVRRQAVRKLILAGDIAAARNLIDKEYPELLLHPSAVDAPSSDPSQRVRLAALFALQCQQFIELLRGNDLVQAMDLGQQQLACWADHSPETRAQLQEVYSMLAYSDVSTSAVAYLLDVKRREHVAAAVNSAILTFEDQPAVSPLLRLVQHTQALQSAMTAAGIGDASFVKLRDYLQR